MFTAQDARKVANNESMEVTEILQLIEIAAHNGFFELTLNDNYFQSQHDMDIINDLGYGISWNRALLEYTVSW